MLNTTVSGSFHRHMAAVYSAVGELRAAGAEVLSPSDPRIVDSMGDFLFVASDKLRSIRLVQDRHFAAIRNSDLLWVVNPDGYTGPSTSAEIGAAYASNVPIFSDHLPLDITLQHYVTKVPSIRAAVEQVRAVPPARTRRAAQLLLIDPKLATESAIRALERMGTVLAGNPPQGFPDAEAQITREMSSIREILGPEQWH
jgi:hypothetical protein